MLRRFTCHGVDHHAGGGTVCDGHEEARHVGDGALCSCHGVYQSGPDVHDGALGDQMSGGEPHDDHEGGCDDLHGDGMALHVGNGCHDAAERRDDGDVNVPHGVEGVYALANAEVHAQHHRCAACQSLTSCHGAEADGLGQDQDPCSGGHAVAACLHYH